MNKTFIDINNNNNNNNNNNKDYPNKLRRFKCRFLANSPNGNSSCNLQLNRKVIEYGFTPGSVVEITPNSTPNTLHNIQSPNFSFNSTFHYQSKSNLINSDNIDGHASPILLQITNESLIDDIPQDTLRIDGAVCMEPFNLSNYSYVNVKLVSLENIKLDLVELIFKEQYFNGCDMWRIKKHIQDSCVYIKKNIEYCGMRFSVREMWMNGEIVTCGYISEETRLVFRSQSAMCTIYIQMSNEMWEFDVNGEMYHEKAINFLAELFTNWKNQTCAHDVTIALFSRVFYEAESIDKFPSELVNCVRQDHKNRFYEDFYRVVYQNERYDDWMFSLVKLKHLIKEYRDYILHYHERHTCKQPVPRCYLSNAAEGNFLETLNLSSSVFERIFIDRPFDRTGMMSVVITGGCGVFEVNRELSKITKGRVIDNGIGSDLVCLGEQPLHQVPLFKYSESDTYSVPYWINLSFYKSSNIIRYCNFKFRPRIKIRFKNNFDKKLDPESILPGYQPSIDNVPFEDTDDIFLSPQQDDYKPGFMRQISKQQSHNKSNDDQEDDLLIELESDPETSNNSNKYTNVKKLNPFSPSTICPRRSFDRRRWAHLFPLRPDGTPIFQHWKKIKSIDLATENIGMSVEKKNFSSVQIDSVFHDNKSLDDFSLSYDHSIGKIEEINGNTSLHNPIEIDKVVNKLLNNRKNSLEIDNDECFATMMAGVAWKSLTMPACLPLTTDYTPDENKREKNFVKIKTYTLILDSIREEYDHHVKNNKNIKIKTILPELVGHRIALGFQLVQFKNDKKSMKDSDCSQEIYKLCSSHTFHELLYSNETDRVNVNIWVARKELDRKCKDYEYGYRFQVPDSELYNISYCEFLRNSMKINWEKIDHYICIQGNGSLSPLELQNCWRQRLYVIPLMYTHSNNINNNNNNNNNSQHNLATVCLTHSINASLVPLSTKFDIYQRKTKDELKVIRESNFIRFMEFLNKLTRADDRRIVSVQIKNNHKLLPSPKDNLEKILKQYDEQKSKSYRDEITKYLKQTYREGMLVGIPMLTSKDDIPPKCFISAEATWWCMQNVKNIETESEAIQFLQILLDFEVIKHISRFEKSYIHGFYLYYILTVENKEIEFEFTKDYCEVGLCDLNRGLSLDEKNLFYVNKLPKRQTLLPVSDTEMLFSHSQYGLNSSLESSILKIVNVDVDSQKKSTRIEWASALYRSCYHPLCAFELEIYWKMATGQLLSELITNWSKKSYKFNYHMVPGPLDPFATPFERLSDPLRGYIYIPLNLKTLMQNEKFLFNNIIEKKYFVIDDDNQNLLKFNYDFELLDDDEFKEFLNTKFKNDNLLELKLRYKQKLIEEEFQEFIEYKRILYLQYFQEAILERFGFIRNAAITKTNNSDEDTTFFIHSSGGMFVMVPNYYATLSGRSRHPSSANQQIKQQFNEKNLICEQQQQQQQQQTKFDLSDFDYESLRLNDDFKEDNIIEIKHTPLSKRYYNSISLIVGDTKRNIKNKTLKRANSTSKLQLKFYELNIGNIKNSLNSPKYHEKNFLFPSQQSVKFLNRNSSDFKILIGDNFLTDKKQPFYMNNNLFIGFLWSWNFMLGKRWRSQYTGDEAFQDSALADFRAFCSNKDNRLINFFNSIK